MGAAEDGTQGLVQAMDHEYAKGFSSLTGSYWLGLF